MASVKVKFKPSTVAGRQGTIYYQILHERKQRQLFTSFHPFSTEWDERRSMITNRPSDERKVLLLSMREKIRQDVEIIWKVIRKLDSGGLAYSVDEIIAEFDLYGKRYSLFHFMESIIDKLKRNGKTRTSETYRATLKNFRRFRNDEDLMLDSLSTEIIEAYEAWQKGRGICLNTISFYMRILRAVYRRAVEEEIIEDRKPFRRVYTGIDKTVKRALPLPIIRKIKALDLSQSPKHDFARDMFMMSFMLRGMSFIDMAYLRKSDLANGHVTYRRRKTGQQLRIKWTKEMQAILDKYEQNKSDYLLPILRKPGINERSAYRNSGYKINRNLKRIAERVGVEIPLTLYVARHSWASAAKGKGVPVSVISEGMGHDSETTTKIYLASLDTNVVDEANSLIIGSL